MAWIHDRYTYDKRIQLGYEEIVRPLSMGTNWQSLRIGIRFAVNDAARVQINQFALLLGVCQGNSGILATSTTDWIGGGLFGSLLPSGTTGGATSPFTAGTPNYFAGSNQVSALWKTGVSITYGSVTSVTSYMVGTGAGGSYLAQNMNHLYVDIAKGSPNYSVTDYYADSIANVQTNITDSIFRQNMERATATPTNTASGAKALAYTGSGLFDSVSVSWWKAWPNIEIDSLWIVRIT